MIIATTETVPGKKVVKYIGLVKGNSIRARHIGQDIKAVFKNILGGEINEYTKMMAEAREQSIDRMCEEAESLGANAILGVRFTTTSMMQGAAELLIYGSAVVVEEEE